MRYGGRVTVLLSSQVLLQEVSLLNQYHLEEIIGHVSLLCTVSQY